MLSMYEESQSLRTTGAVMYVVGISAYLNSFLLIPSGYILRGIGAGKTSGIADDYNLNNKKNGCFLSFFPCHYARKCSAITRKYGIRNDV
jgi:hypothetical protein